MDERVATDDAILRDPEKTLGAESEDMRDAIAQRLFGIEASAPRRIGRYQIEHRLGRGAMGTVFAAVDPNLGRTIALKVLHRGGARSSAGDSYVTRLLREAKLLAKLSHPNVVSVYDVGEEDGVVHIAMELVRGRTLREWLELHAPRTRSDVRAILDLFQQAARGLAAAHAAGVVHRDFKPENVLVGDDGRVRVADFGLAVGRAEAPDDAGAAAPPADDTGARPHATLTATGQLVGTPAYMAPEQFSGGEVGPAADQYAFCVALFEALHGRRPFQATTVQRLAQLVLDGAIEFPSTPHVSASVRAVLRRGLSRDAAQRFFDMKTLSAALHRATTRWRRWAIGGLALSAALSGAAVAQLVAPRAAICSGGRAHVQAVWNPERAQQLQRAFAATGLPWADDAAQRAIDALDRLAREWPMEHEEACEATRVRGEQSEDVLDRRIACLDRQLRAAAALVDVWTTADAGVVEHVDRMVDRVPDVGRCRRVDDLLEKDPLPADLQGRAIVSTLQDRLDRVAALQSAGKVPQAALEEAGIIEAAEATGHRPTIARAWSLRASTAQMQRQPELVSTATNRALVVAVAAAEDEMAATLAVQIASHYATILRQPGEAAAWAQLALAFADRAGGLERIRALALITAGHAQEELGASDEALRMVEEGTRIFREIDPASAPYGRALADLSGVHATHGRVERARPMMVEAIAILTKALGRRHPDVAHDLMNLATIDLFLGDARAARSNATEAVELLSEALGPDNLRVSDALETLGAAEKELAEHGAASRHFERAVEIRRKTLGPDHHTLLRPLENHATVLARIGEHERAAKVAEDAARILETAVPRESPERTRGMIRVGFLMYSAGLKERGLELAADGISRLHESPPQPRDFELMLRYGAMLRDAKQPAEAVDWLRRAEQALEAAEPQPQDRALVRQKLAEALWDLGEDRPAAIAMAEEARALVLPIASSYVDLSREIDAWLSAHR